MNVADKLSNLIDLAGKGFNHIGYNSFELKSDLENLRKAKAFFTTTSLGMQAVSRVIEDQALTLNKPFRLYSAFQKFSRFKRQEEHYLKIAATQNPIYIFGLPDTPIASYSQLIPVKIEMSQLSTNLAEFWFVVLHSPELVSMALLAREVPNATNLNLANNRLLYRTFEGFWTYDTTLVGEIVACLDEYLATQNENLSFKASTLRQLK